MRHPDAHGFRFFFATLLIAATSTGSLEAQGKEPSAAPDTDALRAVHAELLAYDTADARSKLSAILDESNPAHLVLLGRILEQEKSYGPATDKLRRASELAPSDATPQVYLGETYLHWDKSDDARRAFERARDLAQKQVEGNGDDARAHLLLGVVRQRLKSFDDALRSLERARALAGDQAEILYQIGATRAFQERWQEAVDAFNNSLAKNDAVAYAYYYRGLAHSKMGRKDLMIEDLNRFLTLAPNAPEAEAAKRIIASARR